MLPGRTGIEWPPIPSGLLRRTVPWGEASLLAMTDVATFSAQQSPLTQLLLNSFANWTLSNCVEDPCQLLKSIENSFFQLSSGLL